MSEPAEVIELDRKRPTIKKTDWIYFWLFRPVFWLPLSFTPNHVSYLRLIICIPIYQLLIMHKFHHATALFLLAALMDGLDGAMARIRDQETESGKVLDPLADKVLNITSYLAFWSYVKSGNYPWLTGFIVTIDTILAFVATNKYLISYYLPGLIPNHWLRNWFDPKDIMDYVKVKNTGANNYGKTKMVLQIISLSAMMLFDPNATYFISNHLKLPWQGTMFDIFQPLLAVCVIFGALSLYGHVKVVHFGYETK